MKDNELLEQKSVMDRYLNLSLRPLSSFSFVSVFAWCDFFDFEFRVMGECLCIFAHGDAGTFLYLPPLGKEFDSPMVDMVFKHMAQGKKPSAVHRIENIPGNSLSAFKAGRYNQYTKPVEYVYHKKDLIALKGNAYKSQRHDCNCFKSRQPGYSFEAYSQNDFEACLGLYERWADKRAQANSDEIYRAMLQENRLVHGRLLKHGQVLGLVIRVLKVDGKIIGYTLGYALNETTFCIYAEIADLSMPGAAAFMFNSFCADPALERFTRINTMDDFAMPLVAAAKKAYHPSELIESYTVSLKA